MAAAILAFPSATEAQRLARERESAKARKTTNANLKELAQLMAALAQGETEPENECEQELAKLAIAIQQRGAALRRKNER